MFGLASAYPNFDLLLPFMYPLTGHHLPMILALATRRVWFVGCAKILGSFSNSLARKAIVTRCRLAWRSPHAGRLSVSS